MNQTYFLNEFYRTVPVCFIVLLIIYLQRNKMGNDVCCKEDPHRNQLPTTQLPSIKRNPHAEKRSPPPPSIIQNRVSQQPSSSIRNSSTKVEIPKLSPQIQSHLEQQQPLEDKLPKNPTVKQFGDQVFVGEIDFRGRPDGYGKMYRNNGSLFIGRFQNGVANGIGHYVKPDGSFYSGNLRDNKADDENGYYWSPNLEYRGGIHNNKFDGAGQQKGQKHEFNGKYRDGNKVHGTLIWEDNQAKYTYTGPFNDRGDFQGKGKLEQSNLGTYIGQFQDGEKHGTGEFQFISGKKYIGQYFYGVKQGYGKTINKEGVMTYEGNWQNGLPHGQGKARNKLGQYVQRQFVEGLDKEFLDDL